MSGGLIAWWTRNPVAANLMMFFIIIAGIVSFFQMEREVWPTVRANWVQITVPWPGGSPVEVEDQIIVRIEEAMNDLDNIERIRSWAVEGLATIYIEANRKIDIADFIAEVKLRVDSINSFPRDIENPRVREVLTRNEMIRIAVHSPTADERDLKRFAEQVRDEVSLLSGVSIVELFGARREEVSIELSEEAMRRYGLTFDEVANAIRANSINISGGTVRTESGEIQVGVRNMADTQEDFEAIIVRQTDDGALIRVGDVATVKDGFEDKEILASMNGEPAVLVQIMTSERMNVVKTSEAVREYLETAGERVPPDISLTLWWDSSKIYFDRMETISKSAGFGLILVLIILVLTLRPIVAFWVAVGIATAYSGAFIFLPVAGVSLNMLSLFAFLLVIGIVVDDAIVVGESIHREAHIGGGGLDSAAKGAQFVSKPVVFAVLTTMIAFAPWMFLSGLEVEFTKQISFIVIAALTFSLIESLLILPTHLRKLKPRTRLGKFGRFQKRIADSILIFADKSYRPMVTWAVDRRYLTMSIFFGVLIVSIGIFASGWLRFSFMPEVEDEQISVNVEMPEGAPYARALEILGQMQVAQRELADEVARETGGQGKLIENWYTRARSDSVLALVKLAPPEVRNMSSKEAADRLREKIGEIPDAKSVTVRHTIDDQDPGIQYSVNHPDLDVLRLATEELREKLAGYATTYDVRHNLQSATDEIRLVLKPGAQQLGLTLGEISRQVRQAYFGEEVQRLPRGGSDVRVYVRYPLEARRQISSLADFRVRTGDGREVPLLSVADIEFAPGLKRIDRRERQRSAVVSGELKDDVRDDIHEDLKEDFFPEWKQRYPGVSTGAIGEAEGEAQFMREILTLSLGALIIMYILIAIAFHSYFQPILIMTAIPFGFVGAVAGHLVFDMPMALFSYFGLAAAAGVVVNDNLVLVDYINRLREKGTEAFEALVEGGVARFRPILLTSVTTFVGLVPMMLERSTQAQFLKPTVVSVAFGVALATFVTLLLVPAFYAVGLDIARTCRHAWEALVAMVTGRRRSDIPGPAE
ncbi:MAG: efflux RND transporter permease subunit [Sphingomonadales bacterium]|nr:efflux RND transporter permease subunit [Sphingomonadales bacterium]